MRARAPALAAASLAAALAALAGAAGAAPLRAQDAPSPPTPQAIAPTPAASPLVPPDHWAWAAARRLDVLGLAPPGFDRGRSLRTRRELEWLFERAAATAARERPGLAALANGYLDRFREEFGYVRSVRAAAALAGPAPAVERPVTAALSAGYERLVGRAATGVGYLDWTGARPIPDTLTAFLAPELAWLPSSHLSLHAEPVFRAGGVGLRQADLVAVLGPIGAWAGRRTVRFGPGEWGGIVLDDGVPLDGFGGFLARPIRFPWILRAMGPIQIESFFSKAYGGDTIRDPFFVAFRGTMAPSARLTVGLDRAAMFAGRGNQPITLKNMAFLALGGTGGGASGTSGGFANDVLSVDVTYRPPVERWLPLVTYLEWGMDDAAGMWHRSPAIVAGLRNDAVPGLPWLSLGVERTSFAVSDLSTNTMWYRDWSLRNGWADAGVPVGHPLGGEGTELLGTAAADLLDARLRLTAHVFRRHRGNQNLFAPERMGVSHGGALRLEGRIRPDLELLFDGRAERGAGGAWSTSQLTTSLRWMH